MKIIIQSSESGYAGPKYVVEKTIAADDLTLETIFEDLVIPVLIAYGYSPEGIKDYIK